MRASMRSVPSAASIASTRASATTTAWPTSNGLVASSKASAVAMSAWSRAAGSLAAQRPLRHQNFRRDFVCANQPEAVLLENCRDALEQAIVAAAQQTDDPRKQPERLEIRPDFPDRRPHHRADEHHIPAALALGDPAEPAELPERGPMMRIAQRPRCGSAQPRMANSTTRRPRLPTASATANGSAPPPQITASGPSPVRLRSSRRRSWHLVSRPAPDGHGQRSRAGTDEGDHLGDERNRRRLARRPDQAARERCRRRRTSLR